MKPISSASGPASSSLPDVDLSEGCGDDLDAINAIVEAAVMSWPLPERVKRLSLPSYRYTREDLRHQDVVLARDKGGSVRGVAVMEEAAPSDVPGANRGLLLHGLYVHPDVHGQGIGTRLLAASGDFAARKGFSGVLVKSANAAVDYFAGRDLIALPVSDPSRDYPYRFWMPMRDR